MNLKNIKSLLYALILIFIVFILYSTYQHYIEISHNNNTVRHSNILEIKVDEAFKILNNKNVFFIDARDFSFFNEEKIPGAYSYPFSERDMWAKKIVEQFDLNDTLIVYCDSYLCGLSKVEALYLKNLQFENVIMLSGGLEIWKKNGYPTVK
jgi:rhodanese-related sulfurtransferase